MHLMAPEPASTVYTPQPRGEANIAKTTPTAAHQADPNPAPSRQRTGEDPGPTRAARSHPFEPELPEALYEALREAAFRERCKIHDIVLERNRLAG